MESITPYSDGRKRIKVLLPDLDWVLINLHVGRPKYFPIKKVKEEYHVPQYLNFTASLINAEKGTVTQDQRDWANCINFGTAKLIHISKAEKRFTVIIYGANL